MGLAVDGVGVMGGHDDGLALVEEVLDTVDGDAAGAVQAGDEGVAAGFVGADLLALIEGEEGDADGVVLGQGLLTTWPGW